MVSYGAIISWKKAQQARAVGKLTCLPRISSSVITGTISSSLSLELEALLDLPFLHMVVERRARLIVFRIWRIAKQSPHMLVCSCVYTINKLLEAVIFDNLLGMSWNMMCTRSKWLMCASLYYFPKETNRQNTDASRYLLVYGWFENRAQCGRRNIFLQSNSLRTLQPHKDLPG